MIGRRLLLAVALGALGLLGLVAGCGIGEPEAPPAALPVGGDASPATAQAAPAEEMAERPTPEPTTSAAASGDAGTVTLGEPLPPAPTAAELGVDDTSVADDRPVAVSIPALGLDDTVVRAVGVEPDGSLEVPPAVEVGWYRWGAVPGGPGSAVLAGHIAFDGVDGAFRDLTALEPGDEILLTGADGSVDRWVVERSDRYAKADLPFDDVFAESGPPRLTLVTCGGAFDAEARSYTDNDVVTAVPAP